MPRDALDPMLFIGSSTEGLDVAENLQVLLDRSCEVRIWTQGIFAPTSNTLAGLLDGAERSDFAVLILTADDTSQSRGQHYHIARDNVVFELGLFLGALGPQRVFIVKPRNVDMHLPSDLAGTTVLDYRPNPSDGNLAGALGAVGSQIAQAVVRQGLRPSRAAVAEIPATSAGARRGLTVEEERGELRRELNAISRAAEAQNWRVKTDSESAYRLVSRNGQRYSFTIGEPAETRDRLRTYASQLKDAGLRISQAITAPVTAS